METTDEHRYVYETWDAIPEAIARRKKRIEEIIDGGDDPLPHGMVGFDYLARLAVRLQSEKYIQHTVPHVHHQVLDIGMQAKEFARADVILTVSPVSADAFHLSIKQPFEKRLSESKRYITFSFEEVVQTIRAVLQSYFA